MNRKLPGQQSNEIIPPVVRTQVLSRRAMCVQRNSEARSYDHCCSGKSVKITHSEREKERERERESVCVALGIQHAMNMRHIVTCDLPRPAIFFYIIS